MIDIIVNPVANGKKALKCAAAAEKRLKERGAEYRIHYTNAPKHATEIARELSKTSDTIVALGGDGTINEVFNGIDVDKVKLGLIPCGSGNDFVASAKHSDGYGGGCRSHSRRRSETDRFYGLRRRERS